MDWAAWVGGLLIGATVVNAAYMLRLRLKGRMHKVGDVAVMFDNRRLLIRLRQDDDRVDLTWPTTRGLHKHLGELIKLVDAVGEKQARNVLIDATDEKYDKKGRRRK